MAATNIRYCYYAETDKILGQTFGMLVLQARDAPSPALTPPFPFLRCCHIRPFLGAPRPAACLD